MASRAVRQRCAPIRELVVGEKVAEGGTSLVIRGRLTDTFEVVAVKSISPRSGSGKRSIKARRLLIQNETRVLEHLHPHSHPYIPAYRGRANLFGATGSENTLAEDDDDEVEEEEEEEADEDEEGDDEGDDTTDDEVRVGARAALFPSSSGSLSGDGSGLHDSIILEFVTGDTLTEMIDRDGAMSEALAMRLFYQLAEALAYLASRCVAHRDIKPDNIIVDPRHLSIKLIDFGLATVGADTEPSVFRYATDRAYVGTPLFMAPEVLSAGTGTRTTPYRIVVAETWSAGMTLLYMLLGHFPLLGCHTVGDVEELQITALPGIIARLVQPEGGRSVQCLKLVRSLLAYHPACRMACDRIVGGVQRLFGDCVKTPFVNSARVSTAAPSSTSKGWRRNANHDDVSFLEARRDLDREMQRTRNRRITWDGTQFWNIRGAL